MALPHVSEKLVDWERITSADIFNAPAERVIAQGRLLLCALAALVIQFAPTQPTQYAATAELILWAYLAFAAILVALTRYRFLTPTMRGLIHLVDIVMISELLFLTDGPTSPFFVFFTFALLAAMLRWQWQVVIATVVALMGVLFIVWITRVAPTDNNLDTAIIRGAYLTAAGGMLAYVSTFYRRSRERFAILAAWPMRKASKERISAMQQLLAHSAVVLEASRILAIWEEAEEPYVNLAFCGEDSYQETRRAAGTFGLLVNPALVGDAFLTGDASSEFVLLAKGSMRLKGPVIDSELQTEFSIRGVATAPFAGTICTGRVFILDRSNWNDDDLLLTETIASRTGTELDRQVSQRQNEEAIALRERIRLSRDVHDGVLQSLTAAALQINLADQSPDNDRKSRLDLVKQLLAKEQRRVREFVDEIFPKPIAENYMIPSLDLQQQLEETAQYWNCKTSFLVTPPDARVPEATARQLSLMLAEAVANAVRHGGASNIDVVMEKTEGSLVINVRDNGKGFGGQPTEETRRELLMAGTGATSVRERVCALGGSLTVSSSPAGAELAIRLPVP